MKIFRKNKSNSVTTSELITLHKNLLTLDLYCLVADRAPCQSVNLAIQEVEADIADQVHEFMYRKDFHGLSVSYDNFKLGLGSSVERANYHNLLVACIKQGKTKEWNKHSRDIEKQRDCVEKVISKIDDLLACHKLSTNTAHRVKFRAGMIKKCEASLTKARNELPTDVRDAVKMLRVGSSILTVNDVSEFLQGYNHVLTSGIATAIPPSPRRHEDPEDTLHSSLGSSDGSESEDALSSDEVNAYCEGFNHSNEVRSAGRPGIHAREEADSPRDGERRKRITPDTGVTAAAYRPTIFSPPFVNLPGPGVALPPPIALGKTHSNPKGPAL